MTQTIRLYRLSLRLLTSNQAESIPLFLVFNRNLFNISVWGSALIALGRDKLELYYPAPARAAVYYWFFVLVILSGPWFIVRFHSAISLTDIFLVLSGLYLLTNRNDLLGFLSNAKSMLLAGCIFAAATIYSLIVPFCITGWNLSFWRAAVTASQYGCIFFLFPVLASGLRASLSLKTFTRLVALAYLVPLLVQICYAFFEGWAPFSDYFFSAGRALLSYGNANSAAIVISISVPFFVTLILEERAFFWRAVGLIGLITSSSCLLLTGSTSGTALFICTLGGMFIVIVITKPSSRSLTWIALILFLAVSAVIGTALLIAKTRSESDQLRYRVDLARDLSERAYKHVEHMWTKPTIPPPKPAIPAPEKGAPTPFPNISTPILDHNDLASRLAHDSDLRIPSASLRLEFMWESLDSVRRHLYGLYGEGIGQAQALREERITHLVYLLLLEEGGWPLLFSYFVLLVCLYRNLWLSDDLIEYRLCLLIALSALALGGIFQTHMYARFYWIPIFFAFAVPSKQGNMPQKRGADFPYAPAASSN